MAEYLRLSQPDGLSHLINPVYDQHLYWPVAIANSAIDLLHSSTTHCLSASAMYHQVVSLLLAGTVLLRVKLHTGQTTRPFARNISSSDSSRKAKPPVWHVQLLRTQRQPRAGRG